MAKKRAPSFDDILDDYQRREDFVPFAIVMASGDKYVISDPFMMVNGPSEVFYATPQSGLIVRLRKSQIVAVEQMHHRQPAA